VEPGHGWVKPMMMMMMMRCGLELRTGQAGRAPKLSSKQRAGPGSGGPCLKDRPVLRSIGNAVLLTILVMKMNMNMIVHGMESTIHTVHPYSVIHTP